MRSWEPESVTEVVAAACLILQRRPVAAMSYFAVAGSRNEKTTGKNIEDIIEESGLLGKSDKGVRVQGVTCPVRRCPTPNTL